jgi:hypothetical protein
VLDARALGEMKGGDHFGVFGGPPPKKLGRKPSKHSSEDYAQTSIYQPIGSRNGVRAGLHDRGMGMSGPALEMPWGDWPQREGS